MPQVTIDLSELAGWQKRQLAALLGLSGPVPVEVPCSLIVGAPEPRPGLGFPVTSLVEVNSMATRLTIDQRVPLAVHFYDRGHNEALLNASPPEWSVTPEGIGTLEEMSADNRKCYLTPSTQVSDAVMVKAIVRGIQFGDSPPADVILSEVFEFDAGVAVFGQIVAGTPEQNPNLAPPAEQTPPDQPQSGAGARLSAGVPMPRPSREVQGKVGTDQDLGAGGEQISGSQDQGGGARQAQARPQTGHEVGPNQDGGDELVDDSDQDDGDELMGGGDQDDGDEVGAEQGRVQSQGVTDHPTPAPGVPDQGPNATASSVEGGSGQAANNEPQGVVGPGTPAPSAADQTGPAAGVGAGDVATPVAGSGSATGVS
jgi:hypothetical protein